MSLPLNLNHCYMNKQKVLQRIARYLMLHGSFTNNLGLLNGKMGTVLFFMHYARYEKNKRYERFAGELIDEIYDGIHIAYPQGFGDGLAGIAWGMEYLVRNGFVKAEPDELLGDLDARILERNVGRISDDSLENGLRGLAYYAMSRCMGRTYMPYFNDYLQELLSMFLTVVPDDEESIMIRKRLMDILRHDDKTVDMSFLINYASTVTFRTHLIFNEHRGMGIAKNGYVGIGLNLLLVR